MYNVMPVLGMQKMHEEQMMRQMVIQELLGVGEKKINSSF
jgi:hypothetical protein